MTSFPNGICGGICHLKVPPCEELLQGTGESKSVAEGRALSVKLQVTLQPRWCLRFGSLSAQRTPRQSNNVVPGGSTGLLEACGEVAGPAGFQGNLISSTLALQKARTGT